MTRGRPAREDDTPFSPRATELDDLIRPGQHRRRDREAEGFGGVEVHDQFERRGLLDRKIIRLRALEDTIKREKAALDF